MPAERLTAPMVAKDWGDLVEFLVFTVFLGLLVLPVWTVTVNHHSVSYLWWRRPFQQRTPAWRAPATYEGPKLNWRILRDWRRPPGEICPCGGLWRGLYVFLIWSDHLKLDFFTPLWLKTYVKVDNEERAPAWIGNKLLPQFAICTVKLKGAVHIFKYTNLAALFLFKQQQDKSESVSVCLCKCVNNQIILLDNVHFVCKYPCLST